MITIENNDLPIVVAQKIVCGTKPTDSNLAKAIFSENSSFDMFSIEEIKEIADYLMVYVESHKNGD